jgi:hypothetical protein
VYQKTKVILRKLIFLNELKKKVPFFLGAEEKIKLNNENLK